MSEKLDTNNTPTSMVYQEMYAEMRRHRDYELSGANWCTIILLAIVGGVITIYTGNTEVIRNFSLFQIIGIKVLLSLILLTVGGSGILIVIYSSKRYKNLRKWVTKKLEPKDLRYSPKEVCFRLRDYIIVVLIVLTICSIGIVWVL